MVLKIREKPDLKRGQIVLRELMARQPKTGSSRVVDNLGQEYILVRVEGR